MTSASSPELVPSKPWALVSGRVSGRPPAVLQTVEKVGNRTTRLVGRRASIRHRVGSASGMSGPAGTLDSEVPSPPRTYWPMAGHAWMAAATAFCASRNKMVFVKEFVAPLQELPLMKTTGRHMEQAPQTIPRQDLGSSGGTSGQSFRGSALPLVASARQSRDRHVCALSHCWTSDHVVRHRPRPETISAATGRKSICSTSCRRPFVKTIVGQRDTGSSPPGARPARNLGRGPCEAWALRGGAGGAPSPPRRLACCDIATIGPQTCRQCVADVLAAGLPELYPLCPSSSPEYAWVRLGGRLWGRSIQGRPGDGV